MLNHIAPGGKVTLHKPVLLSEDIGETTTSKFQPPVATDKPNDKSGRAAGQGDFAGVQVDAH